MTNRLKYDTIKIYVCLFVRILVLLKFWCEKRIDGFKSRHSHQIKDCIVMIQSFFVLVWQGNCAIHTIT